MIINGAKSIIIPSQHPRAIRAQKCPVSVDVLFADGPGFCETLEGRVQFKPGDALLRGVEGECWPIKRPHFDNAYQPLPGTQPGLAGQYCKKPLDVWALQLTKPYEVKVGWQDDPIRGDVGDWLIQYGENDFGIVADHIFKATYQMSQD